MLAVDTNVLVRYLKPEPRRVARFFAGLQHVMLEDLTLIMPAIAWTEEGMDFVEALDLSKQKTCDAVVTFDKDFIHAGSRLGTIAVRWFSGGSLGAVRIFAVKGIIMPEIKR